MRFKKYVLALLASVILLAGCAPTFDGTAYVTATMKAFYKGDFLDYSNLTGISTAEASVHRSKWLDNQTDNFISALGFNNANDILSDTTTTRVHDLLEKIYATAKYEVTSNAAEEVIVTISPIQLITDNYTEIQTYVNDFNAKNDTFGFTALTEQEYADTYFDGLLTILENHLAEQSYGDAVQVDVIIEKDANGLYTISDETMQNIEKNIIAWPQI